MEQNIRQDGSNTAKGIKNKKQKHAEMKDNLRKKCSHKISLLDAIATESKRKVADTNKKQRESSKSCLYAHSVESWPSYFQKVKVE